MIPACLALLLLSAGFIALPWVMYPWLMIRRAARHPAPVGGAPPGDAIISVVVATREPVGEVRARIEDLLSGNWPPQNLEIVVAVDGDPASYRFPDLAPALQRLLVVGADTPGGKASALNAGVRAATADILVFTDTHQRFAVEAIPRLAAALSDERFGAVSGALRLGNERGSLLSRYWEKERRVREAEGKLHSTIGVSGSIYAMRRSLWSALPAGLILDDLWVPMQLVLGGHRVGFEPLAEAFDTRSTAPGQEFRRKVRTLTGNFQLIAWMPAVMLPWRNPVWPQFVCHKLLRLLTPFAALGLGLGILCLAFTRDVRLGWLLLGALPALLLLSLLWRTGAGARLRSALIWGLSMQGAIVVATWKGLRGQWDVWKR
jgi:glycosyl transferase family 2